MPVRIAHFLRGTISEKEDFKVIYCVKIPFLPKLIFCKDSKQLTEKQRDMLFTKIVDSVDIGFEVIMLSPEELSHKMLRK